jgi:hypothetical protein
MQLIAIANRHLSNTSILAYQSVAESASGCDLNIALAAGPVRCGRHRCYSPNYHLRRVLAEVRSNRGCSCRSVSISSQMNRVVAACC